MTTATPPVTYQPESAALSFQQGASDKVYHCQLTQAETGWSVTVQYGRRNSTLTSDAKIERVTYEEAKKVYDRTVREKTSKGYQGASAAHGPQQPTAAPLTNSRGPASKEIVFQPELLTRITEREAQSFASNPRYFFQTKQDGDRLTVRVHHGDIHGYNKLGQRVRLDPKLHDALATVCFVAAIDSLLMDGEWEPTGYYCWEVLECKFDLREQEYEARLAVLETIFAALPTDLASILHLTATARTTEEKLAMLADRTKEGVCVKDKRAPFRPGRNGQHKKFKFEQTASFIVGDKPRAKANDGHRSVALYVHHNGVLRFVATVKVQDKYTLPALGSIVEVRYLYAYPKGGIAQPCYFGKVRTDVRPEDCSTAQLKFKAE